MIDYYERECFIMDRKKLIKKIENMKKTQSKIYSTCVKKIVNEHSEYCKDKEYADFFKTDEM